MTESSALDQTTNPRDLPQGWQLAHLRDVISEAQGGFASGERDAEGTVQLRMNNVSSLGKFDWSSYIRVPATSAQIGQFQLRPGDVLFNNTNSVELVGKSALFEGYPEPVTFSNHFTRLRTDKRQLDPAYLRLWLQLQWSRGLFADICNRWIGQAAVQRDKLLALTIPLPTLSEQRLIAALLTDQLAAVDRARTATQAQLDAAQTLRFA
jgi:type I restriction enzyme S subunit